ncbi:MAG: ABC transporter permease, partial [Lachnospiraceae bacterium]|nr:ABC transporter permease [Lachnospiraceae bacterium]
MRNPMNRRYLRELKADFGKYLVIFLFIIMVVSVVSSFLVANAGVAKAYYGAMEKNHVESGHLAFNVRPDDELLERISSKAQITFYPADYFEEENDGVIMRVYRLGSDVNLPELMEGRLPEAPDEIAIDNLHSLNAGIKIGDRIQVDGHLVTVTGFVALPNYTALFKDNADLMFDIQGFGVGVMSEEGFDAFSSEHVTIGYAWT